jgi:hypothetical protein
MSGDKGPLVLPERAFDDLAVIAGSQKILGALAESGELISRMTSLGDVATSLAKTSGFDVKASGRLLSSLMPLVALRRSLGSSGSEIVHRISASVDAHAPQDWRAQHLLAWRSCRDALARVLEPSHPLSSLEKAIDLVYSSANMFSRARLLTDLRPVFSENAERIERTVVTFMLMIEYYDGMHSHRLDLALDSKDVKELSELCLRALKKVQSLKSDAGISAGPVSVAGEIDG